MIYSNASTVTTGRFASQMLRTFGTQRTVRTVQGIVANTFKYIAESGPYNGPSIAAGVFTAGTMVAGYCAPDTYNQTRCYFIDRGAGFTYADTMTMLSVDMSRMLGVSTTALLEQSEVSGRLDFSDAAYYELNKLRDPGNQVAVSSTVNNRRSLQSRQIRA